MNLCACGCGQFTKTFRGRYVRGHQIRAPQFGELKRCSRCEQSFPYTEEFFKRRSDSKGGLDYNCKSCRRAMGLESYYRHHERNKEKGRLKQKLAWNLHKDRMKAQAKERYRALRLEMIAAYGGRCSCCGESEPDFLTLEHINHDGQQHRAKVGMSTGVWYDLKKRGWPKDGYTILCWNCNMATAHGRTCPHQRPKPKLVIDNVG